MKPALIKETERDNLKGLTGWNPLIQSLSYPLCSKQRGSSVFLTVNSTSASPQTSCPQQDKGQQCSPKHLAVQSLATHLLHSGWPSLGELDLRGPQMPHSYHRLAHTCRGQTHLPYLPSVRNPTEQRKPFAKQGTSSSSEWSSFLSSLPLGPICLSPSPVSHPWDLPGTHHHESFTLPTPTIATLNSENPNNFPYWNQYLRQTEPCKSIHSGLQSPKKIWAVLNLSCVNLRCRLLQNTYAPNRISNSSKISFNCCLGKKNGARRVRI